MMNLRSLSISRTWKVFSAVFFGWLTIACLLTAEPAFARIYIDINAPSVQRLKIAIPDFKNFSERNDNPELAAALPAVLSNDLDLSGFFAPMDKNAFLSDTQGQSSLDENRFRDWSVIGADLLVKAGYTCIGQGLEVEVRLYDILSARQVLGKRFLGRVDEQRTLMHRVGNEIIYLLTGNKGMFLSRITFVGTATGHKEIYTADFDGHNEKQLTSDKAIALLPRWSPLGDVICFNSYKEGSSMLYLKDLHSGKVRRLSDRQGFNAGGSWAPDGRSLALGMSHGDNLDIFNIDLSGKILKRLTNHSSINVSASFSPDGSKFAFVSNRSGTPQVYVKDMAGEREERITFEGNYNTSPSWSKLNRIVFCGSYEGRFDIFTVDPDGRNLRKLTDGQGDNEEPCWSPDGRYILFSSNREGGYHLYIMNANGQNQRRITFMKGQQTSPSWSPF
ncbi:MAG: Tol-Pal system beta propeller repeat protein TolB [Desulfobacteraceae bacterium]|nr:MAG: Tol-Pal system beta propeller repeat protein TolB [Desulfobacteraceae bacterium]